MVGLVEAQCGLQALSILLIPSNRLLPPLLHKLQSSQPLQVALSIIGLSGPTAPFGFERHVASRLKIQTAFRAGGTVQRNSTGESCFLLASVHQVTSQRLPVFTLELPFKPTRYRRRPGVAHRESLD